MLNHCIIYNHKYFAIVEDGLANKISRFSQSNRVWPLDKTANWDNVIEKYQQKNKRYVVIEEDAMEDILEYFG